MTRRCARRSSKMTRRIIGTSTGEGAQKSVSRRVGGPTRTLAEKSQAASEQVSVRDVGDQSAVDHELGAGGERRLVTERNTMNVATSSRTSPVGPMVRSPCRRGSAGHRVRMKPGWTGVDPNVELWPISIAADLASPRTAHLDATYGCTIGAPRRPSIDDTLMIDPPPTASSARRRPACQGRCRSG